jgi:predicted nucleic-acid-binding protein
MKGLDTNVLVRFLVADDPDQSGRAKQFIQAECTPEVPGYINVVVLCELVWVLERSYDYPREDICAAIESLLRAAEIAHEDPDAAWAALRAYRDGHGDFADAMVGHINRRAGCTTTVTFDRRAARLVVFEAI